MDRQTVFIRACLMFVASVAHVVPYAHAKKGAALRTVALEIENEFGLMIMQIPVDNISFDFVVQFVRDAELRPRFTTYNGTLQCVLSIRKPAKLEPNRESVNLAMIGEYHDQVITSILTEIREHCKPTLEQLKKLETAATAERARLSRKVGQITNLSVTANIEHAKELSELADEISELNNEIKFGPSRSNSLIYNVIRGVLSQEQQSFLRWQYMQPLVSLLESRNVLTEPGQRASLRKFVSNSTSDPFDIRYNYGQQFKLISNLGDENLLQFMNAQQLASFHQLGKSEYRITLSLATQ